MIYFFVSSQKSAVSSQQSAVSSHFQLSFIIDHLSFASNRQPAVIGCWLFPPMTNDNLLPLSLSPHPFPSTNAH
jgi:hypothetical protein